MGCITMDFHQGLTFIVYLAYCQLNKTDPQLFTCIKGKIHLVYCYILYINRSVDSGSL